ncbi:hypothetical protein ONR57_11970 [Hoyosella sp. YIM 151337]|uniref:hypothetical protein n=1 Tax=Hoyosella sp. YIM 151337 TaxID=2992742 RepID=UPI0022369699|nr:hypothetical protein [Hoyosella sp. YIM 151337]MCW4354016.1 hypothetical protein [Hoyosella sp. YIM 151337]
MNLSRGHRVTYANDPSMGDLIAATGAELKPYRSTLPKTNSEGADQSGDAEKSWAGDAIDQLTLFQDDYESMLPQLRALYEDDKPDLFLYDIAGGPARILAHQWNIPSLQLSPTYVAWNGYEDEMKPMMDEMRRDPRGAAGVAVRVDSATVSAEELRQALQTIDGHQIRRRSAELAHELKGAGGAAWAADIAEDRMTRVRER